MDAEQAFWFCISNPTIESSNPPPVKVEVPSELPKVSLVNASLKKLKFHLAQFDSVVKNRTTPDARTEGEWGFEHTKAVFNNEIIPFLKILSDIFNVFDRDLLNKIMEVQTVFNQMDAAVQQFSVDKQLMNSMSLIGESVNMEGKRKESCNLEAELLKSQNAFNDLLKRYSQLERHCISLESSIQLNQEIFQKDESCNNQNAFDIPEYFENNDLKAHLQDKDNTICMFKLDLEPLAPRLLQNREAHINYLKYTHEQADILRGIVEQAKAEQPLNKELDFAGAKLMGLQLLQLELRLEKNPSRSFRPDKSAEILWQFWTSYSLRVSLAQDGSWSKWEPSLWLCG
ncbi:hypothetical protein Tco_1538060 [Tanacetum coccineum]